MGTRYYYNIRHGLTVQAIVRLNGIVVHQGSANFQNGISGRVDHFLTPGDNELEVDILGGDIRHESAFFYAGILRADDSPLAVLDWPADFPVNEFAASPFPLRQMRRFSIATDHPVPLLFQAPIEIVPPEGTTAAWAPVKELFAALERGDAAPIYDLFATRAAEFHRFYALGEASPAGSRQLIDSMMAGPYDMLPLQGSDVFFRPCAAGRGAQLLRLDGRPAIAGQCRTNPKIRYTSNPVLVRIGKEYRIVA